MFTVYKWHSCQLSANRREFVRGSRTGLDGFLRVVPVSPRIFRVLARSSKGRSGKGICNINKIWRYEDGQEA